MQTRNKTSRETVAAIPSYGTIDHWCQISGMSRRVTYDRLGSGELRAVKIGARTLIDIGHGLAWMRSLPPAAFRPRRQKHAAHTP